MQANNRDFVLSSIEQNGASLFSRLLYRSNRVLALLDNNQIKLIMAPIDSAIQRFQTTSNKSFELLISSQLGQEIVENHLSTMFSQEPNVTSLPAVNGQSLLIDSKSVSQYQIVGGKKIGDVVIYFISIVILTSNQSKSLAIERSAGLKSLFGGGNLGNTGLNLLIQQGGIKGQDLIALCNSNFEASEFCSKRNSNGKTIFDELLQKEFGVTVLDGDARAEYINHHNNSGFVYWSYYDGNTTIDGKRYLKVSDSKYLSIQPQYHKPRNELASHVIILYCIGLDHKLSVYTTVYNPQDRVDRAIMQILVTGIPDNVKVQKVSCGDSAVIVLAYDGSVYISAELKSGEMKHIVFGRLGDVVGLDIFENLLLYKHVSSGKREILAVNEGRVSKITRREVSDDTIRMSNTDSLNTIEVRNGKCLVSSIYISFDPEQPSTTHTFNLSSFPGGEFAYDFDKIGIVRSTSWEIIFILTDSGYFWFQFISTRGNGSTERVDPLKWVKVNVPDDSKITSVNANQFVHGISDPRILLIDQTGRVYAFSVEWNATIKNIEPLLVLKTTIPGAISVWRATNYTDIDVFKKIEFILMLRDSV